MITIEGMKTPVVSAVAIFSYDWGNLAPCARLYEVADWLLRRRYWARRFTVQNERGNWHNQSLCK
jgi:hypothetical protein